MHPDYFSSELDDGSSPMGQWHTPESMAAELDGDSLKRVLVGWDMDDGQVVAVVDEGDEVEITGRTVTVEVVGPKGKVSVTLPERIPHPTVHTYTPMDLEFLLEMTPAPKGETDPFQVEKARVLAAATAAWLADVDPFQAAA